VGQWPHPTTSEVGWEENSFEVLVLNVELGLRLPELFGPRNDMLLSVAGGVYPECKHQGTNQHRRYGAIDGLCIDEKSGLNIIFRSYNQRLHRQLVFYCLHI